MCNAVRKISSRQEGSMSGNMKELLLHFSRCFCGNTHVTAHLLPLSADHLTVAPSKSSHCSALAKQPFSGAPASRSYLASHAHQIRQLINGRVGWPTETCIKRGHFASVVSVLVPPRKQRVK